MYSPHGGPSCLRKNHDVETHYSNWPTRVEISALNPDDLPYVPSADQTSYKIRL